MKYYLYNPLSKSKNRPEFLEKLGAPAELIANYENAAKNDSEALKKFHETFKCID